MWRLVELLEQTAPVVAAPLGCSLDDVDERCAVLDVEGTVRITSSGGAYGRQWQRQR